MHIQQPEPFRIVPKMPASAYKTYALSLPKQTHYRKATCQEVEQQCTSLLSGSIEHGTAVFCGESHCGPYMHGWVTYVDVSTDLGQRQAYYIRMHSGRSFTTSMVAKQESAIRFTFPPGQQCFADHQVPLERDPFFIVRGGDWRGNPRGEMRSHVRAADWVEDFAEHQQRIVNEIEKG